MGGFRIRCCWRFLPTLEWGRRWFYESGFLVETFKHTLSLSLTLCLTNSITEAKAVLIKVVSMLVGLIKAVAPDRVYEEPGGYVARLPEEQVKEQDKRA